MTFHFGDSPTAITNDRIAATGSKDASAAASANNTALKQVSSLLMNMKPAIGIIVCLSIATGAEETATRVAICDVLRDPVKWNEKMVEVSGPILAVQNYWVMGQGCDGVLNIKETTFPSGFVLAPLPDVQHQNSKDYEAWVKLDVLTLEATRTKRQVFATVTGRFETRDPIDSLINESAPNKYQGFGHMGGAPGQIIVKIIRNLRIDDKDSLSQK